MLFMSLYKYTVSATFWRGQYEVPRTLAPTCLPSKVGPMLGTSVTGLVSASVHSLPLQSKGLGKLYTTRLDVSKQIKAGSRLGGLSILAPGCFDSFECARQASSEVFMAGLEVEIQCV
jgi:hypothetical protein